MNLPNKTSSSTSHTVESEATGHKQFHCVTEALVLYQRKDRLGARLEGMLSAWRFAKATRRKLIVYWPDRGQPGAYAPSLFFDLKAIAETGEADDLSIHFSEYADQLPRGAFIDLRKEPGWPFFLKKWKYLKARDRAVKIMTLHSTYFCFRWEFPWRVVRELKQLFSHLIPARPIQDALAAAMNWIEDPDFIAVHIRRGDVIRDIRHQLKGFISSEPDHGNSPEALKKLLEEEGLGASLHAFVKRVTSIDAYIAAIPPNNEAKIVVFSDTLGAALEFQARLPDSRSVLISAFKTELTRPQQAYFELLLLSKASRVISTASCFSRLACQCGRPSFHDARNTLGAEGTRAAFRELFGNELNGSELLRSECQRILDHELALDRWARMPDWLVALFPSLAWISLK